MLSTLHEHSGGLTCWEILRERRNVTVTQLELPTPASGKDEIIDAFRNAITPRTKVMSFCHINFTTGLRMPVKELCQLARDNVIISVVDGAHAIGMINLNLADLGCDFYATSPHKWLNAPPGTGVLYIREGMLEHCWPTVTETAPTANSIIVLQVRGQQCTPAFASYPVQRGWHGLTFFCLRFVTSNSAEISPRYAELICNNFKLLDI